MLRSRQKTLFWGPDLYEEGIPLILDYIHFQIELISGEFLVELHSVSLEGR